MCTPSQRPIKGKRGNVKGRHGVVARTNNGLKMRSQGASEVGI